MPPTEPRCTCGISRVGLVPKADCPVHASPPPTDPTAALRMALERLVAYHRKQVSPTLQMSEMEEHPGCQERPFSWSPRVACQDCDIILGFRTALASQADDPSGLTVVPDHTWRYQSPTGHAVGCCVHPGVSLEAAIRAESVRPDR